MPKTFEIHGVPDSVHQMLAAQAAVAGLSLSEFVKREFLHVPPSCDMEVLDRRIQARGPSNLTTRSVLADLHALRGD